MVALYVVVTLLEPQKVQTGETVEAGHEVEHFATVSSASVKEGGG